VDGLTRGFVEVVVFQRREPERRVGDLLQVLQAVWRFPVERLLALLQMIGKDRMDGAVQVAEVDALAGHELSHSLFEVVKAFGG